MLAGQRLLIIEDAFLIALEIQRILDDTTAGTAVFARNFAEVAELVDRFGEFDLVIVNPPKPGSPEMDIVGRIVEAGPAFVVCTGARIDLTATPLADAEQVIKPFADDDLLAACRRASAKRANQKLVVVT